MEYMSKHTDIRPLTADRCATECIHPEHVAPLLGRVIGSGEAEALATIFTTLADPTRAKLVHALALSDELCVCDLSLLIGLSQSAVSHQLRLLRDRRVVSRRKAGRIVYYRLADEHVRHVFADGLRHVTEAMPSTARSA
jgi:DNA-binding transcriptional ArsR family regulator